jgi:hypothetical protein
MILFHTVATMTLATTAAQINPLVTLLDITTCNAA